MRGKSLSSLMVASETSLIMTDIRMFSRSAISFCFCLALASLLTLRLLRKARHWARGRRAEWQRSDTVALMGGLL